MMHVQQFLQNAYINEHLNDNIYNTHMRQQVHGFIRLRSAHNDDVIAPEVLGVIDGRVVLVDVKNITYSQKVEYVLDNKDVVADSDSVHIFSLNMTNSRDKHLVGEPSQSLLEQIGNSITIIEDKNNMSKVVNIDLVRIEPSVLNLDDVRSYTHSCNYNVSVSLQSFSDSFDRHIGKGLILEPDFQRGHVWTEEQQCLFIEHLLRGGAVPPIYLNHPGWMGDFKGDFVCVDGLQRITAMRKFVSNELKVFGQYYFRQIDGIDSTRSSIIVAVNTLKTRAQVLQWYIELNSNTVAHTKDELENVRQLLIDELHETQTN